jgi:hypothetical protein
MERLHDVLPHPAETAASTALVEGDVVRVHGRKLLVEVAEELRVWTTLAVPPPYRPSIGDRVVVLAQGGHAYAVGVVTATADPVFEAKGDLVLRAGGTVRIAGEAGVAIESDGEVSVRARLFRTVADKLRERLGAVWRVVRGCSSLRAGEVREDVEGDHRCRADRVLRKARGQVRIDGEQIHLG